MYLDKFMDNQEYSSIFMMYTYKCNTVLVFESVLLGVVSTFDKLYASTHTYSPHYTL